MSNHNSTNGAKTARKHFTLIELLVVIAIIAILAAMLLPALNKARERGRAVTCVSQHKSVGSILLMYAEANDGYLPPVQYTVPSEGVRSWIYSISMDHFGWTFAEVESNSYDLEGSVPVKVGSKMVGLWQCPSSIEFWVNANIGYYCYVGNYSFNSRLFGWNSLSWPCRKITSISQPSGTGVMFDGLIGVNNSQPQLDNAYFFMHRSSSNYASIDYRHSGMSSILYLDGHAVQFKPDGIYPPIVKTDSDRWWK